MRILRARIRKNREVTAHIPEAEAYIRYRLNELSSRNEHHRFEEIATRVAQKRISSNIMIATVAGQFWWGSAA